MDGLRNDSCYDETVRQLAFRELSIRNAVSSNPSDARREMSEEL